MRAYRKGRWAKIQYIVVTKRHSLWEYADDGIVAVFRFRGQLIPLGRVMRTDIFGKWQYGYIDGIYYPHLVEVHESGEAVRVMVEG